MKIICIYNENYYYGESQLKTVSVYLKYLKKKKKINI